MFKWVQNFEEAYYLQTFSVIPETAFWIAWFDCLVVKLDYIKNIFAILPVE